MLRGFFYDYDKESHEKLTATNIVPVKDTDSVKEAAIQAVKTFFAPIGNDLQHIKAVTELARKVEVSGSPRLSLSKK